MNLSETLDYLISVAKSGQAIPMIEMSEKEQSDFRRKFGPAALILGRFAIYEVDDARKLCSDFESIQKENENLRKSIYKLRDVLREELALW